MCCAVKSNIHIYNGNNLIMEIITDSSIDTVIAMMYS